MRDYVIYTDSACDLTINMIKKRGIYSSPLSFRFDSEDKSYSDYDMPIKAFYSKMREGCTARTSAVNPESFYHGFEKILKEGRDVLYLGFSSGLSTTYNSARIAANELKKLYPKGKIITTDTRCASCGMALLVDMVIAKKRNGATIEDAADYAENMKYKICHWFTVDDLVYLKRGGRISKTTAFVGNALGIKPILRVDDAGRLVNTGKVRGRKASIYTLANKYDEMRDHIKNNKVYISHADCPSDAEALSNLLKEKYNANIGLISNVGSVIGAHAGPGTIALFFVGKDRKANV